MYIYTRQSIPAWSCKDRSVAPGIAVLASRVLGARKQICAYLELIKGVSDNRGRQYSTLNSRILIIRTPK